MLPPRPEGVDEESWKWILFAAACWECGAVQFPFPAHYFCDKCRKEE